MIEEHLIGTPKDLNELVLSVLCARGKDFRHSISLCIRDYLAQKFNSAMLKHPDTTQVLEELFQDLIAPLP